MAQDAHLFSVRRPRETLGAISNNMSAIPMPTSAMKRSSSIGHMQQAPGTAQHKRSASGSRMSLAPGRPSQPVFTHDIGPSTAQRSSSQNLLTSTGRKSLMPGSFSLAASTPAPLPQSSQDSQRRSSVYSARPSMGLGPAGHQSFFATAPPQNSIPVDPRRLKDPNTRAQMGQELMEFLTQRRYELETGTTLTHKSMTSPTQKEFVSFFQFMYHCIDPAYRFQKSIDAEAPPLLKQMRYPFEKNISKSQLAAVGGNNWSTFLGLLHWMMQLAKMMEAYATGQYDHACAEAGYDIGADRISFQFLSGAYKTWLSVEDDDDDEEEMRKLLQPHVDVMAQSFANANSHNLEQLQALEDENKAIQDQIDDLGKTAPRLAKLSEQIKVLEEDRDKFEAYNQSMDAKVEKYENRARVLEEEMRKVEIELQEAEDERRALQDAVDAQGITVQDIDRMTTERKRLQNGVENAAARLDECREVVKAKETETGQKLEELEDAVSKYNSLGYLIGIIPSDAANAHGDNYELVLTVNRGPDFTNSQMAGSHHAESDRLLADGGNGYQPHHLLNLDLRGSVKSNILALKKEVKARGETLYEQDQNNCDLLHKIKEAIDDKQAEVEALSHRVQAAEQEFEETRENVNAQKMKSDAQIEKMEKELQRMRAGLTESVQLMEQREMNTNIEYEQLTLKSAALREELHTELEKIMNDVIKFKVHIQTSLENYEEFVAQEVEAECEEQEAAEAAELEDEEGAGED
ncbi:hypothetical protein K461DRAFT_267129 [Myriangium duriaei CBS 260.36]|uniref:Kinetochore protein NDC80 n=1 Tax=Myriangium duriaei CBS 260.36 TaxID=1168546 RepID=A0A9P4MIA0_9PEZI|nr:hypothetical protein K461DRAFT_267129 [Myriangium duriaei CBS 260.36]